ncbi:RluA family pseudouridine synthase [Alkalitalea saponilacus]|uniref:Pseudouridine synthase n=1 Tax=Alkalitalea saponilacus TaxID=889453 RepID=A0A1T5E035_9BACT|nr:RluA family pseudouridine synthase [Alkalitalea saponilacus]ASB49141.1 RluA family pseudouridine synthase [Alkalitalea saponilacus]SKB77096.1 23S rRNA pseudouridine1911/1915/1917 synthase [Alkalitalea saponilacus]
MIEKINHTIHTHTAPEGTVCQRISDYLPGIFPGLNTKSSAKKSLKRGDISYNNHIATTANIIQPGDEIVYRKTISEPRRIFNLKIDVVYEDDELAVINKPAGIVVNGNQFRTIENALPGCLKASPSEDALMVPQPVHRLDSLTSGLLMVAKTHKAHLHLSRQFQNKTIKKQYNAVVIGKPEDEGTISTPIENRKAITRFRTLKTWPSIKNRYLSLLSVTPETGRTHQIRIHLKELGFPILGDPLYGTEGLILKHRGLFLCAMALEFTHPVTNKIIHLETDPPPKFFRFPEKEKKRYKRE